MIHDPNARPTLRTLVMLVAAMAALLPLLVPLALAQGDDDPTRRDAVVGALVPPAEKYFATGEGAAAPNLVTSDDLARVAGFGVRQHPVNLGRFDDGCAQCHRLAGPMPKGHDGPPDLFDRLEPPAVARAAPEGFTRLTSSEAREEYPSWSPDGETLLYEATDAEGSYQLWTIDPNGDEPRRITDHAAAGWATWQPDGDRIAYWAADPEGRGNLWLYDLASAEARRLTDHEMTAWPQWSPDGTRIAYQAMDDDTWTLRLLDPAQDRARDLTRPADVLPSRPLWSPDGGEILYQSLVGTRFELTRMIFPQGTDGLPDYAGEPRRQATTTVYPIDLGAATDHAAWHPSQGRIAYLMYTLEVVPPATLAFSYKTWTIAPDGTRPKLMMPDATLADRSPTWNARGTWLAQWSWGPDLRAGVWLVNADGTRHLELTRDLGGDALYPAWSPDGTRVAFASNRAGTFDIWIADVERLIEEDEGNEPR